MIEEGGEVSGRDLENAGKGWRRCELDCGREPLDIPRSLSAPTRLIVEV